MESHDRWTMKPRLNQQGRENFFPVIQTTTFRSSDSPRSPPRNINPSSAVTWQANFIPGRENFFDKRRLQARFLRFSAALDFLLIFSNQTMGAPVPRQARMRSFSCTGVLVVRSGGAMTTTPPPAAPRRRRMRCGRLELSTL